jgi:hypothetical protein
VSCILRRSWQKAASTKALAQLLGGVLEAAQAESLCYLRLYAHYFAFFLGAGVFDFFGFGVA